MGDSEYKGNGVIDLTQVETQDLRGLVADCLVQLCVREDTTLDEQLSGLVSGARSRRAQFEELKRLYKELEFPPVYLRLVAASEEEVESLGSA